ncbi:hypothetical protein BB559_007423 [Furculomyces boomerangus]|uniref:CRAL-TRIO domain-containing protein n=2 Tax=Harpellales TaxID=61421 RepID=A0A2T9XXF7_9FUNG|nr:hypothetical protein BB559_007423 [Furculomyces boomerangus]PVZ97737.1 hypothetical protein BB558_006296 [Smittium angustum]
MNKLLPSVFRKVQSEPKIVDDSIVYSEIPLFKPLLDEYESVDNPMTEVEQRIIKDIIGCKDDIFKVLPTEKVDKGSRFDYEAWLNDESNILRYVRARKNNLEEAKKAIIKTLIWRIEYRPHAITPSDVEHESLTGKTYLNGFDLNGRPVLFLKPHLENTKDPKSQIKSIVFYIEKAIKSMPKGVTKITILIDTTKMTFNTLVSPKTSIQFLDILQSHYPERLGKGLIVNPPGIFVFSYKVVSPFIDPVTKKKIMFVDLKSDRNTSDKNEKDLGPFTNLSKYFDLDRLEIESGGNFPWRYNHSVYWKHMEKEFE